MPVWLCLIFAVVGHAYASEMPPEIRSLASGQEFIAVSYQWDFEYLRLEIKPDAGLITGERIKESSRSDITKLFDEDSASHFVAGSVVFDATSGRLKLEVTQRVGGENGLAETSSFSWAYDGEIYSSLETTDFKSPVTAVQKLQRGTIERQLGQPGNLNGFIIQSGLPFFPQFCPQVSDTSVPYDPLTHRAAYLQSLCDSHKNSLANVAPELIGISYQIEMSPFVYEGKKYDRSTASTFVFDRSKVGHWCPNWNIYQIDLQKPSTGLRSLAPRSHLVFGYLILRGC